MRMGIILALFLLLGSGQALDLNYRIGGMNDQTDILYHGELSSTEATWINWTSIDEGFSQSLKIKPQDDTWTYMIIVVKVKV